MPVVIVVGAQWGDEGKGKIVDLLAKRADVVVRYGGGANAGHTIYINGKKYVFHLLPSGLLRDKPCVLGGGMVIDPEQLLKEMAEAASNGIDVSPERLMISSGAHIVLPTHKKLDAAWEKWRGGVGLGTTRRGIGPSYQDKILRFGLRMGMMSDLREFEKQVFDLAVLHNIQLDMLNMAGEQINPAQTAREYKEYAKQLGVYIKDTVWYLQDRLQKGRTVLAEGAQGTLLDIDHGGYPYVTSSSTVAGAAVTSLGVDPRYISRIIGVAKCFQTRVGEGPMPTEIICHREGVEEYESLTLHLRGERGQPGSEHGATTGRERRVGWMDLVLLRYAARINGLDELILTKLDVLSGLETVKLCTAYERDKKRYQDLPPNGITSLKEFVPYCDNLIGWEGKGVSKVRNFSDLPELAQFYVNRVQEVVRVPVSMVSVGTDREDIIIR